jgi:hypothetical protein
MDRARIFSDKEKTFSVCVGKYKRRKEEIT